MQLITVGAIIAEEQELAINVRIIFCSCFCLVPPQSAGWSRWASWCAKRQVDPVSAGTQHFLEFLAGLYDQGLQHRSINAIKSAVLMTHKHIEGSPVRQHPLITRPLKGVYNKQPPQPCYTTTWDVYAMTRHLVAMGSNKALSLNCLPTAHARYCVYACNRRISRVARDVDASRALA